MIYISEFMNNFSSLLQNAILLFALGFFFATTSIDTKTTNKKTQVIFGIVIGVIAYFIILNPLILEEGLIFDTRSVLLSVTGLFFGGITTVVAALIAGGYRIYIGGPGVYAGLLTIITASSIGFYWRCIKRILPKKTPYYVEYYLMGVIVHIVTLLCFLAIPWPQAFDVIKSTALIYLLVFPFITLFLALFVHHQKDRFQISKELKEQKVLLQSSIDSTSEMEIYAIDLNYNYLSFNKFHVKSMKGYYNIDITLSDNFLDILTNDVIKKRIKTSFDRALSGESFSVVIEIEERLGSYLEEAYAPIYDLDKKIIGATVFIEDITRKKQYENEILELSYKDALTGLNNRRKHLEQLIALDQEKYHPISVVFFDINGLKIMNDAFGHMEGDRLIKLVANKLLICCNDHKAFVSRLGGDEFIVLCPNTTEHEAQILADQAKAAIEVEQINHMNVSISYGVSSKETKDDFDQVISRAETHLYQNKLYESSSHRNETIKTIVDALKVKDEYSEAHSTRVSQMCKLMGKSLGMNKQQIHLLEMISKLHDIGKIAIPDEILNKPGKLSEEEWTIIKRHPETGYRILSTLPEYMEISEDILSHHERYDGKGYPRGLQGEDIPIRARIISIVDAFDAMTSDRPYRKKMSDSDAIDELISNKGTQFDPKLVDVFMTIFNKK